jgi:hypothetical protein
MPSKRNPIFGSTNFPPTTIGFPEGLLAPEKYQPSHQTIKNIGEKNTQKAN